MKTTANDYYILPLYYFYYCDDDDEMITMKMMMIIIIIVVMTLSRAHHASSSCAVYTCKTIYTVLDIIYAMYIMYILLYTYNYYIQHCRAASPLYTSRQGPLALNAIKISFISWPGAPSPSSSSSSLAHPPTAACNNTRTRVYALYCKIV